MQENKLFLNAKDVLELSKISLVSAYRLIKKMNMELQRQGKIVIAGKISKRYFEEKMYL